MRERGYSEEAIVLELERERERGERGERREERGERKTK